MKQYEYNIVREMINCNEFTISDLSDKLNDLGQEGWKLVQIVFSEPITNEEIIGGILFITGDTIGSYTLYLEREIVDNTKPNLPG